MYIGFRILDIWFRNNLKRLGDGSLFVYPDAVHDLAKYDNSDDTLRKYGSNWTFHDAWFHPNNWCYHSSDHSERDFSPVTSREERGVLARE